MFCPQKSEVSTPAIIGTVTELLDSMMLIAIDDNHMAFVCGIFLKVLLQNFRPSGAQMEELGGTSVDDQQARRVQPIVQAVLAPSRWNVSDRIVDYATRANTAFRMQSVVVPGFEGRDRQSTGDFMRQYFVAC
jgi:hypothetical protein